MREILRKIGLTKGETEIYLTLLKTGSTTTGPIINKSNISRSKVYEVLEKLKKKGLATEIIKHNTKYFEAATPNRIKEYLLSQKKELEILENEADKIIPSLEELQSSHINRQEARVYLGIEGWKTLYTEILNKLNKGEEYLAFGISRKDIENSEIRRFIRKFHLKRGEKGVKARLIMRKNTKDLMKKYFSNLKDYKYKFLKAKFPTNINLHKDSTVILVNEGTPIAFQINSKEVTRRYKEYFEELWKQAKR